MLHISFEGQSLNSHQIAFMFGSDMHGWIDMNIFHTDDELRKQGELLANKVVITGQEAVDSKFGMREDRCPISPWVRVPSGVCRMVSPSYRFAVCTTLTVHLFVVMSSDLHLAAMWSADVDVRPSPRDAQPHMVFTCFHRTYTKRSLAQTR